MAEPSIVAGGEEPEERAIEAALRPKNLHDFVGQHRVRKQLSLVLEASRMRDRSADHVLLSGPPGLGKTTLSMIIAAEMNVPLRISSGPAIQHAGDLAAILSSLSEGEVLFLDEIHRMSRPAEEMLYMAMEDFRVDIVVGKGAGATAIPLELPPFTLVGATTRAGLLPGPLRDRFGFTGHLEFYSVEELELVLRRSAGLLDLKVNSAGFSEIAGRSRGTPRIANRLLRRVRDWALVHGIEQIDARAASAALDMYEVDKRGLDRLDRAVLEALITKFGGGRWAFRRWRSPSARKQKRWKRSPSRTSSARDCWAGRRGAASPWRLPGRTWASAVPQGSSDKIRWSCSSPRGRAMDAKRAGAEIGGEFGGETPRNSSVIAASTVLSGFPFRMV